MQELETLFTEQLVGEQTQFCMIWPGSNSRPENNIKILRAEKSKCGLQVVGGLFQEKYKVNKGK